MKKLTLLSVLFSMVVSPAVLAAETGGIAVGATRVIYNADSREASLAVINHSGAQYFLIQSWVDDSAGSKKVPFTITPPLFRLNANKENMLRIIKSGEGLPQDRESVYWVNVKAIPPAPEGDGQNTLQLAVKTRIKMFYRPKGLPGNAAETPKKLEWHQQGDDLVVKNPTAYSASFNNLTVDGKEVKDANLVLPQSEVHYKLNSAHASKVAYKCINDFGGLTDEISSSVN
ncbi:fimbria/pilus periplasmic chaperone [Buttiauxella selenatireducens]|uniref:Fimbria/pilus periplasmic chaperone n=1 Tax=Buttiauxella selenatireducens TaxID=3073902 RepID=A0ABY9SE06_9ENTR|nr:fimbria/pilus periplasmic chaperone [Buttiauxella sp. R73]WMY75568.1 fimbria/pilus periplasmic chaperone [Buttiauxella sp. R73]